MAALAALNGLAPVAVCDRDDALSVLAPDGVAFFSDEEAFFNFDMDVVVVATPNFTHGQVAYKAMRRGYPVIVEKPAARSLAELDNLLSAATARTPLFFAFHAAHGREVTWAKDWLGRQAKNIGPLTGFEATFVDPYATATGRLKTEAGSLENAWRDSGINALSVLAEFVEPALLSITHVTATRLTSGGIPLDALVRFSINATHAHETGVGTIATQWTSDINQKQTHLIFGRAGIELKLDHTKQRVTRVADGKEEIVADLSHTGERLLNHYLGLFSTYAEANAPASTAVAAGRRLHELLFEAAEKIEGKLKV